MTVETEGKPPAVAKGLKGIKAADSSICLVDGVVGKLLYRGYNIDDLATNATFEEVAWLLLNGSLPTGAELEGFQKKLAGHASLPGEVIDFVKSLPSGIPAMAALRSATSFLAHYDPEAEDESEESHYENAVQLVARLPILVSAISRVRDGQEPIEPDTSLSHAGRFVQTMTGEAPSVDQTRAMDLILTLHAEHGFNASTFTARVIIATLTDMYSAITGAIGALKGKLHGGANTEVLKTLKQVGSVEGIEPYVKKTREQKGKFMGFGHAVYQTQDPRAKHLKDYSERLAKETGEPKWYEMSVEMERVVVPMINRNCNVDFYSASVQHYMGISADLFTCVFAASRIAGWCAHVLEQLSDNKIIRPSANYTGPMDLSFPAITERG